MSSEKFLLQEIQQEAEYAKIIINKEVEICVEELSKISLSDFVLTCPVRPIEKPIEECVLEFERRCNDVEKEFLKRLEFLCADLKFYQYDIVKTAINKTAYGIIDDGPWLYHPLIETKDIQSQIQIQTQISALLLTNPWMLVNSNALKNLIKQKCEFAFQTQIKSKSNDIVESCMLRIIKHIDRILEYVEMDSRTESRIEIFEGTQSLCQSNETLKSSVEKSRSEQTIYWEGEKIFFGKPRFSSPLKLVISKEKTVEAARKYAKAGKKVCILNFASSVAPGGGVVNGSQAQEESICRVSTLYFALSDKNTAGAFYDKHWELIHRGEFNRRNTDDIIYTPGVTVVRDDSNNEVMLPENEWYQIDVITCAAPDIRKVGDETEYNPEQNELYREFVKRWKCILSAGAKHKADVLILGAFGCGVFANPPKLVAEAFCEAVKGYEKYFEIIELAIYSPRENNANYNAFMNVLYGDSPIYPHYLQYIKKHPNFTFEAFEKYVGDATPTKYETPMDDPLVENSLMFDSNKYRYELCLAMNGELYYCCWR